MPETLDDLDAYIAEQRAAWEENGISSDLDLRTTSDGRVWAAGGLHAPPRRFRYHYDPRDPDELPDDLDPQLPEGVAEEDVDYYLVYGEVWEETGDYSTSPYVSENGYEVTAQARPDDEVREVGTIPVVENTVVREERDLRVETFLLWSHFNTRPDLFDEGGLWEEHLPGRAEA